MSPRDANPEIRILSKPGRIIVVGIDPAATAGLVALQVNAERPGHEPDWRWLDSAHVSKAARAGASFAENEAALFLRVRDWVRSYHPVSHVAIERPSDMDTGAFRPTGQGGAKEGRAAATGTFFGVGAAYGLCLAAVTEGTTRVYDYGTKGRRANPAKHKREIIGWMPKVRGGRSGNLLHTLRRDLLLEKLHDRSLALRAQSSTGFVTAAATARLNENELMALGVLLFHLSRQVR